MTISELIAELEKLKEEHGDVVVYDNEGNAIFCADTPGDSNDCVILNQKMYYISPCI